MLIVGLGEMYSFSLCQFLFLFSSFPFSILAGLLSSTPISNKVAVKLYHTSAPVMWPLILSGISEHSTHSPARWRFILHALPESSPEVLGHLGSKLLGSGHSNWEVKVTLEVTQLNHSRGKWKVDELLRGKVMWSELLSAGRHQHSSIRCLNMKISPWQLVCNHFPAIMSPQLLRHFLKVIRLSTGQTTREVKAQGGSRALL